MYLCMKRALLDPHTLSGISRDIAQVFFAAILVDPLMRGNFSTSLILLGLTSSCAAWSFSLFITHQNML